MRRLPSKQLDCRVALSLGSGGLWDIRPPVLINSSSCPVRAEVLADKLS